MVSIGWKDPSTRFEHTWIVAPPKSGKTTLLKTLIGSDLKAVERGQASIIIIEGEGQILNALESLALFNRVSLDIIDPKEDGLSLNPFALASHTEANENAVVDLLTFIIGGLLEVDMTAKQRGFFRSLVREVLAQPDATLVKLRDLLKKDMEDTAQQVYWRVRSLFEESKTFERIFSGTRNDTDYLRYMNSPGVSVVFCDQDILGRGGSAFFGRVALAQIARAARGRSPHGTDIPCYLYIDECHKYIANDKHIIEMLDEVRKYNVGLILAHQRVAQLSTDVADALYHDVGTIIASRVRDPKVLASAMHCEKTPDLIEKTRVGEFALFIRDQIDPAIRVHIPGSVLEKMPKRPHTPRPTHAPSQEAATVAAAAPPPPDYGPVFKGINETLTAIRDTLGQLPSFIKQSVREELAEYDLKPKPTVNQPGTSVIVKPVKDIDPETGEAPAPAEEAAPKRTGRARHRKKTRFDTRGTTEP